MAVDAATCWMCFGVPRDAEGMPIGEPTICPRHLSSNQEMIRLADAHEAFYHLHGQRTPGCGCLTLEELAAKYGVDLEKL